MAETLIIETSKVMSVVCDHFDKVLWTLKARSTDPLRLAVNAVCSDQGCLVCTDGHRMHLYWPDFERLPTRYSIPDGVYDVVSTTKKTIILRRDDEIEYPQYWRILDYRHPVNGIPSKCFCKDKDYPTLGVSQYLRHVLRETLFDYAYLLDAFMPNETICFERAGNRQMDAIVMAGCDRLAMIMPIKE